MIAQVGATWAPPAAYLGLVTGIAALGYVIGSIPFGLLLTRWAGLGDIRTVGSGNIGATNVLRTGNRRLAALTLGLDILKGTGAVLLANWLFPLGGAAGLVSGFAAFLGHLFPVWLGFRGGKGVATYIGVALGYAWPLAAAFCAAWLVVAAISRRSSLAALTACVVAPAVAFLVLNQFEATILLAVMSGLVFLRHRGNIARLWRGEEPKIGARA